jgi:cell wall-associated NlpC family hydrolase
MSHWADQYVGLPWIAGERDCWSFFRQVQAAHFGRQVPAIDVDALNRLESTRTFADHAERAEWAEVQAPQEGDAVLMARSRHPSHIGVWVNGGVLHAVQGVGVVWQRLAQIKLDGWQRITHYRHR